MKKIRFLVYVVFVIACNNSNHNHFADLLLGQPNLKQDIKIENLCKGLKLINIDRGRKSNDGFFTLSSEILPLDNNDIENRLKSLGYNPNIEYPQEFGPHGEPLGKIVSTGQFNSKKEASLVKEKLKRDNLNLITNFTAENGKPCTGPFKVSILEIIMDKYNGAIISSLGKDRITGKELTSSIAVKKNAIAAVNGGFFAWKENVGVVGDPAGISIIDGTLVSEAISHRPALIIDNNNPKSISIAHNVSTNIKLVINGKAFRINGINRIPGKILNCGNVLDSITKKPIHDFVCANPNEIIAFNSFYAKNGPKGEGLEFIIDTSGKINRINPSRGSEIPSEGYLIQVTGLFVDQFKKLFNNNINVASVEIEIISDGGPINLKKGIYAVNGGPTLLHNGKSDISNRYLEGWETQFLTEKISNEFIDKNDNISYHERSSTHRANFYYNWIVRRHPRTSIGITHDNKVYVVVVYGRDPYTSVGASISEMEKLMKGLGVKEAINLDGGGSSIMIVNGKRTGKPSDSIGEREVGDAIILFN